MVLLHLLTLGFCQGKLSIICQMSGPTYHQVSHIHRNMSVGSLRHLLFSYHMIDKEQYAIYLSPIRGGSLNFMMCLDSWTQDHVNDDALLK